MFFAQLVLDPNAPSWLLVLFAVLSGLLISVHLFALLVAICVLPNLESYKYVRVVLNTSVVPALSILSCWYA